MGRLQRIGKTSRVHTCGHCGKKNLASTIAFRDSAAGKIVHFGARCAASVRSAIGMKRNRALSASDRRSAASDGYKDGRYNSDLSYDEAREAYQEELHQYGGRLTETQFNRFLDKQAHNAADELKSEMDSDLKRAPDKRELLPHLLGDPLPSHSDMLEQIEVYTDEWKSGFRKRLKESLEQAEEDEKYGSKKRRAS